MLLVLKILETVCVDLDWKPNVRKPLILLLSKAESVAIYMNSDSNLQGGWAPDTIKSIFA